jgi:hypothetical protein
MGVRRVCYEGLNNLRTHSTCPFLDDIHNFKTYHGSQGQRVHLREAVKVYPDVQHPQHRL